MRMCPSSFFVSVIASVGWMVFPRPSARPISGIITRHVEDLKDGTAIHGRDSFIVPCFLAKHIIVDRSH